MSQLYLCFFGDGPLWDNIVRVPAYPKGFTYFRPFRYRDEWIQTTLLKEIERKEQRLSLMGNKVVVCMRFLDDDFKWYLLPLRQASLVNIDYSPGNHSVYFQLGTFFDFGKVEDLRSACLEIPSSEYNSVANHIFFRSNDQFSDSHFNDQLNEDKIWAKYCDLIAQDFSLPINSEAKKALFLRFELPASDKPAPINDIHTSYNMGKIYGSELSEGQTYELVVSHRIPSLITKHTSTKPITLDFKSPTSNFEISPSSEEISGNYQTHILTISAKKPSGAWEEIIISPQKEAEAQDGSKINTLKLSMQVKIKLSILYRIKTTYIWLIVLWIALFVSVILEKLLGLEANETSIGLILGIALTTLISAIVVFILQQKGITAK